MLWACTHAICVLSCRPGNIECSCCEMIGKLRIVLASPAQTYQPLLLLSAVERALKNEIAPQTNATTPTIAVLFRFIARPPYRADLPPEPARPTRWTIAGPVRPDIQVGSAKVRPVVSFP